VTRKRRRKRRVKRKTNLLRLMLRPLFCFLGRQTRKKSSPPVASTSESSWSDT